jgi:heme/copper-type cytochrome/quinol oxidase subunit 3
MQMPHAIQPRADTGVTNTQMGIWLFLASEVMLFGGLFSAYAFVRAAAPHWPHGPATLQTGVGLLNTILLLAGTACVWRARRAPAWLWGSTLASVAFVVVKALEWRGEIALGLLPSTNTFFAMYFTLTGVHAAHVIGGILANIWAATGLRRVGAEMTTSRTSALALYWTFVDTVWIAIFVLMYLL